MAGKKRRGRRSLHIFGLTLILTVALGSAVFLGGWALGGFGIPQLAVVRLESQLAEFISEVSAAEDVRGNGKYAELLADEEFCRQQNIYAKEAASPDETTIVFAGDILLDDHYAVMAKLQQRGGNIENAFSEEMLEVMRGADIFMVNNEFPYTDRGVATENKKFTFRAKPEYASYLLDMGVDIVSMANNHAYDYGEISLTDSIDTLNGIGMPFVGAGRNLEEAIRPVYFIVNDMKIAFISATQIERTDNPDTKEATTTSPGAVSYTHLTLPTIRLV